MLKPEVFQCLAHVDCHLGFGWFDEECVDPKLIRSLDVAFVDRGGEEVPLHASSSVDIQPKCYRRLPGRFRTIFASVRMEKWGEPPMSGGHEASESPITLSEYRVWLGKIVPALLVGDQPRAPLI